MAGPLRRFLPLAGLTFVVIVLILLTHIRDPKEQRPGPFKPKTGGDALSLTEQNQLPDLTGHVIAPKLGNETLKAELGRAAWKLFHTTFAQFPDKPTQDESLALKTYIHLFQRLYPCGECAGHFGELLKKFPPQVSSRSAAAAWGCHVHNQVNKRLKKDMFDCSKIGDFYDCGCADDEKDGKNKNKEGKTASG